jgi:hypothetical protein
MSCRGQVDANGGMREGVLLFPRLLAFARPGALTGSQEMLALTRPGALTGCQEMPGQ